MLMALPYRVRQQPSAIVETMDFLTGIPERTSGDALRVVSFNIQHGTPADGWTKELGRMSRRGFRPDVQEASRAMEQTIAQLARLDPDVVLLQEVDKGQVRSGGANQAGVVAAGLGMRHWRFGAAFAGHATGFHRRPLSRALPFERGYGLAICSRFPLLDPVTIPFPRTPNTERRSLMHLWRTRRVLMVAALVTPWGRIAIGNTHLETKRAAAGEQAVRSWAELCAVQADARLLAGDFNLSPEAVAQYLAMRLPATQAFGAPTAPAVHSSALSFPSHRPTHRIDQLLASGLRLADEPQAIRLAISDHCAAVFDLVRAPTREQPVEEGLY